VNHPAPDGKGSEQPEKIIMQDGGKDGFFPFVAMTRADLLCIAGLFIRRWPDFRSVSLQVVPALNSFRNYASSRSSRQRNYINFKPRLRRFCRYIFSAPEF
jgi:hypothetical protein